MWLTVNRHLGSPLKQSLVAIWFAASFAGWGLCSDFETLSRNYIEVWKHFYPTAAFAAGDKSSAFLFEDYSPGCIEKWVYFNQNALEQLRKEPRSNRLDERIDAKLLERQVLFELERWSKGRDGATSLSNYSDLLSSSLVYVLMRSDLSVREKQKALKSRIEGIRKLCTVAGAELTDGRPENTQGGLRSLEVTARFLESSLPELARPWWPKASWEMFRGECLEAAEQIRTLGDDVRSRILPKLTLPDSWGRADYARKLRIYCGLDLSPEKISEMALAEIDAVRGTISELSEAYLSQKDPHVGFPADPKLRIAQVFADMEKDRVDNTKEFLRQYTNLAQQAESFITRSGIATLPKKRTLLISLSPEQFEGWGGVNAPGPFNANAETLFNLPWIPDTADREARDVFYRSFNNHFNTVITAHELFPGHYTQLKWASSNPRFIRALFSDELFVEGWATLSESIMLDAGWGGFNPLDRLAYFRKRLENATRAYVSVQMHCSGWTKEQVAKFATEKGLLPPQFAIYLWPRTINNPFQLVSYFLGSRILKKGLDAEKKRKGANFAIRDFCDTILQSGGFPLDELSAVLDSKR